MVLEFPATIASGRPMVTALLRRIRSQQAAHLCRALLYDYTFSSSAEKAKGIWWDRRLVGNYFQTTALAQ